MFFGGIIAQENSVIRDNDVLNLLMGFGVVTLNKSDSIREHLVRVDSKEVRLNIYGGSKESKDGIFAADEAVFSRKRRYKNFSMFLDNRVNRRKKRLLRGLPYSIESFETTVFQLAGCNVRCWYCYVDDELLTPYSDLTSRWVSIDEMIDDTILYNDNAIMDLSGGQPDLVPEWCLWVMKSIEQRGLKGKVFIWQDDNLLTTQELFSRMSKRTISYMANFPRHSRVGCFKGFNGSSFLFNTQSDKHSLDEQLQNFEMLYKAGFEMYGYVTLTPEPGDIRKNDIETFIVRLRDIHPLLPLRIIPIEIRTFRATESRMTKWQRASLEDQYRVYNLWDEVMNCVYSEEQRNTPYEGVVIQ